MMKRAILSLLATSLLASCATEKSSRAVFDITAYGAVDNPQVSSADVPFVRRSPLATAPGGGTVRIPAGHFTHRPHRHGEQHDAAG